MLFDGNESAPCKRGDSSLIWGPYLSLGDSLSDISKELLGRGQGGARIYMNLFIFAGKKKKNCVVKHPMMTANHKEHTPQANDLT